MVEIWQRKGTLIDCKFSCAVVWQKNHLLPNVQYNIRTQARAIKNSLFIIVCAQLILMIPTYIIPLPQLRLCRRICLHAPALNHNYPARTRRCKLLSSRQVGCQGDMMTTTNIYTKPHLLLYKRFSVNQLNFR